MIDPKDQKKPAPPPFNVALCADTGRILMVTTVADEETAERIAIEVGAATWRRDPPGLGFYLSGDEFLPMGDQPSEAHVFDWQAKSWVDPRTLDDHRAAAWEGIKRARTAAMDAGVDVHGVGRFDADPTAALNLTATLAALPFQPDEWTVTWTLFDNTTAVLDKPTFAAVAAAVLAHGDAMHQVGRALRQAIESASSTAAIEAVQWPS